MLKFDSLRSSLNHWITTPHGDGVAVVRVSKDMLRRVNVTLGKPLASAEELSKRRAARERLASLRASGQKSERTVVQAPVVVYFEKDRNQRLLMRMEEFLASKSVDFRKLDVAGDEPTKEFVMREAKCKDDELPIIFVGGVAVGGYNELVAFDVAGKLKAALG